MNDKKYEILMDEENTIEWEGRTLHRIRALKDFRNVKKGDIGGYVENNYKTLIGEAKAKQMISLIKNMSKEEINLGTTSIY